MFLVRRHRGRVRHGKRLIVPAVHDRRRPRRPPSLGAVHLTRHSVLDYPVHGRRGQRGEGSPAVPDEGGVGAKLTSGSAGRPTASAQRPPGEEALLKILLSLYLISSLFRFCYALPYTYFIYSVTLFGCFIIIYL
jgi:hypothetical protein